jgi:hypothetical protein
VARILLLQRAGEANTMPAVVGKTIGNTRCRLQQGNDSVETTLLELVEVIAEETNDDREIVATVLHLLRSGRVRLIGSFRGRRVDAA